MRKSLISLPALALLIGVFAGSSAFAADVTPTPPKAHQYTLSTCIVSGDKFEGGDMGESVTKVYGDQEVKFCCKDCVKKFEKDQAGYLKKIADAEADAAKAAPAADKATPPATPAPAK